MYQDLIVNLYLDHLNKEINLKNNDIKIKRVLSPHSDKVISFIESTFTKGWASEAKAALYHNNPTCFIAVKDNDIIGFACYDATAKGYFGPIGVDSGYNGLKLVSIYYCSIKAMKNDDMICNYRKRIWQGLYRFIKNLELIINQKNSIGVWSNVIIFNVYTSVTNKYRIIIKLSKIK